MKAVILSQETARAALSALHILEFESGSWLRLDYPETRPWWVQAARDIEAKMPDPMSEVQK